MNDVKDFLIDLEKQKDLTENQIKAKKEEIALFEREKSVIKSQIKAALENQAEPTEIYTDTVKEIIINLEKELVTLDDQRSNIVKGSEMNAKQLELTKANAAVTIEFPKKLVPEHEYETKQAYWDTIVELKKLNLFSEEEKFKGQAKQIAVALERNQEQIENMKSQIEVQKAKLEKKEV